MNSEKRLCELNNLTFPPDYFEDEARCGFVITSMMKRYWASQLKVLSEIAKVCEKHGIKWFADCGTLIGAVRHEGYVPWDDDLDICMLRSDWLKFFSVAEKELPETFKVLTLSNEKEYQEIIGRVVNNHAIDFGEANLKAFFSCPYTVGVDIFPLDSIYDDKEKEEDRKRRGRKVLKAIDLVTENSSDEHLLRNILRDIEKENEVSIDRAGDLVRELNVLAQKIYMECIDEDTKEVALMPFYIPKENHVYERALFKDIITLPFEITQINAPARYEEVLDLEYADYMQIEKGGGLHDYPVYKDQELILKKYMGHNPYRYTFDINALLKAVQRYTTKLVSGTKPRENKNIVFLPVKSRWWDTMEDVYLSAKADPNNNVRVIPVPWYECDTLGNVGALHDDFESFPAELNCTRYSDYEFGKEPIDALVVQVPFDGWSMAITVPEFFYSDNLLGLTDELVYVPYFDAADSEKEGDKAEVALGYLAEQPVVVNCDRIILSSDKMRQLYIKKLISMSGEETRNYWEKKIVTLDSVPWCNSAFLEEKKKKAEDDSDWTELVGDTAGEKVIIYYITIAMILKGREKAFEKIKRSLDIIEAADEIHCILVPQDKINTDLEVIDPELYKEYCDLVKGLLPGKRHLTYDEKGMALLHIDKWDAFYGDRGSVPLECVKRGIPVMIENLDV